MIQINNIISKSILAGLIVSFSCIANLLIQNVLISSFVITLLYVSIIIYDCNLFTFKSGFINEPICFRRLTLILLINLFISFIAGLFISLYDSTLINKANVIVQSQINLNFLTLIIKSIITGFLITLSVESSVRQPNHYIMSILFIFCFIITDCKHCITSMFYYGASNILLNNIGILTLQLLTIIIFNFIGCNLFNLFINKSFIYSK